MDNQTPIRQRMRQPRLTRYVSRAPLFKPLIELGQPPLKGLKGLPMRSCAAQPKSRINFGNWRAPFGSTARLLMSMSRAFAVEGVRDPQMKLEVNGSDAEEKRRDRGHVAVAFLDQETTRRIEAMVPLGLPPFAPGVLPSRVALLSR